MTLPGSPLLPPLLTHGSLPVVLNNATSYSQSLVPDDRQDRAYTLKSHTKDADRQYRQNELSLFVQESKQTINVIAGENWLEVADIRHSVVRVLSLEPRKSDTMAPGILALAELADGDVVVSELEQFFVTNVPLAKQRSLSICSCLSRPLLPGALTAALSLSSFLNKILWQLRN